MAIGNGADKWGIGQNIRRDGMHSTAWPYPCIYAENGMLYKYIELIT